MARYHVRQIAILNRDQPMKLHNYIAFLSPIIAILIGLVYKAKLRKSMLLILLLIMVSFGSDAICFVMNINQINNLWVIQLYGIAETVILYYFFKTLMPQHTSILSWVVGALLIFYVTDCLYLTGLEQYNSISKSVQAIVFIGLSLGFFYVAFTQELDIFDTLLPEFIAVIALLVYFTGAFFSFLLASDIHNITNWGKSRTYYTWMLHNIAHTLKNVILSFALWRAAR